LHFCKYLTRSIYRRNELVAKAVDSLKYYGADVGILNSNQALF